MRHIFCAAAAVVLFQAALSPAQAVVVGTVDANPLHSNAAPFGNLQASFFYQQVYDDSAFSGPITISELTFYNSALPGGVPNPGAFQIYLASTNQPVGGIVNNIPDLASATLVYDAALPSLTNGELDFSLSHTFTYNPAPGNNLLLIVRNFNFSASASPLFLDSDTSNTVTSSRHYSGPNGTSGNLRSGLVTGFNENVTAVPEPSTWAMMILGFAGVSLLAFRRRNASIAA